jgi:hypothetical protein
MLCIAVEDGRCDCMSEQGTKLEVKAAMCRLIVKNGLYNPFLDSDDGDRSNERRRNDSPDSQSAKREKMANVAPNGGDRQPSSLDSGSGEKELATAQPYVPPTYGKWNPDPFGGESAK